MSNRRRCCHRLYGSRQTLQPAWELRRCEATYMFTLQAFDQQDKLLQLRSGCIPEICNDTITTGYVVKSIALERAHFKADILCDEANGALAILRRIKGLEKENKATCSGYKIYK